MVGYLFVVVFVASILGVVLYLRYRPELPPLPRLLGPLGLTLLTWIYTLIASQYSRPGNDWPLVPVIVALVLVTVWHVWLIVKGPGRAVLMSYGISHVTFWMYFAVVCMLRITKDGL